MYIRYNDRLLVNIKFTNLLIQHHSIRINSFIEDLTSLNVKVWKATLNSSFEKPGKYFLFFLFAEYRSRIVIFSHLQVLLYTICGFMTTIRFQGRKSTIKRQMSCLWGLCTGLYIILFSFIRRNQWQKCKLIISQYRFSKAFCIVNNTIL